MKEALLEERCKRRAVGGRCIRKAVLHGECLKHATKVPQGRARWGRPGGSQAQKDWEAWMQAREAAREIHGLAFQVRFSLYLDEDTLEAFVRCTKHNIGTERDGLLIESYVADGAWFEGRALKIGDAKRGKITTEYRRKEKWMARCGYPVIRFNWTPRGFQEFTARTR